MRATRRSPLIVGSGIAGLYVAIRCVELGLRPTIVTKSRLGESNTRYAQGGIAAAVGPGDSIARHLRDTERAGAGLVDRRAARVLTEEAPGRIADLVRLGVPFDTVEGRIVLGREAAHSRARILHAGGDATGLQIEETLRRRALEAGVEAHERTILRALRPHSDKSLLAVFSRDDGSGVEEVRTPALVLASGGAGSLYRQSSNPPVATGDGVAVAYRAGAVITDMEFVQFHPTAFCRPGAARFLITEALRGEGAVLRDRQGRRFMRRYHAAAELAPRDVVSRAIESELRKSGDESVFLDATGIPREQLLTRFPTICRFLHGHHLDPTREPIPVAPVAHYMIGGVATDLVGHSSLPGLLAVGEVASTGVHGANRLASNSLLEGLVFGERVARVLHAPASRGPRPVERVQHQPRIRGEGGGEDRDVVRAVGRLLWSDVGIVRDSAGLESAVTRLGTLAAQLEPPRPREIPGRTADAVLVALLIARAAQTRTESRGAHYRTDYPRPHRKWRLHLGQALCHDRRIQRAGANR